MITSSLACVADVVGIMSITPNVDDNTIDSFFVSIIAPVRGPLSLAYMHPTRLYSPESLEL
jgi:hypothetical protein